MIRNVPCKRSEVVNEGQVSLAVKRRQSNENRRSIDRPLLRLAIRRLVPARLCGGHCGRLSGTFSRHFSCPFAVASQLSPLTFVTMHRTHKYATRTSTGGKSSSLCLPLLAKFATGGHDRKWRGNGQRKWRTTPWKKRGNESGP